MLYAASHPGGQDVEEIGQRNGEVETAPGVLPRRQGRGVAQIIRIEPYLVRPLFHPIGDQMARGGLIDAVLQAAVR